MSGPQQLRQQPLRVEFNPSYAAGLVALAETWGISPVAVARRIVREALREHGVLDRPQSLSRNQHTRPGMVHRTLRITPAQASYLTSIAESTHMSRSETVRGVLSFATRQAVGHDHLRRVPSVKRTVRWSVRITPSHDAHIKKVSKLLHCSETDAAAALLASTAARRQFLQHLKHPPVNID